MIEVNKHKKIVISSCTNEFRQETSEEIAHKGFYCRRLKQTRNIPKHILDYNIEVEKQDGKTINRYVCTTPQVIK